MALEAPEHFETIESRAASFQAALAAWRDAIGAMYVHTDDEPLRAWSRSTLPQSTSPRAVLEPACADQVQAVVHIAALHRQPLYAVSCGRNWGYGDACGVTDGNVVVSLRRMNQIVEINVELAYAVIEPGVTQGQLSTHLKSRGLPLWIDATGAGPDTSVVGNTLDRGYGHGLSGGRASNACGFEVVLADGRLLKTGFGHYHKAESSAVYKAGVGPCLDDLFTQSNLGIVTRMTIWLQQRPPYFKAFFFSVQNENQVGQLVDALRPLRMAGTLRTPVHIFNDLRLLGSSVSYPWHSADGQASLSAAFLLKAKRELGFEAWHGFGAISGNRDEVAAAVTTLRRGLRHVPGLGRVILLDDQRMKNADRVVKTLGLVGLGGGLKRRLDKARLAYSLLQGESDEETLRGALWRVRELPEHSDVKGLNPLDHGAGLVWIAPVLPMTGQHVDRVNGLLKPIFLVHGFEYQVTMTLLTSRAICAAISICYDRSDVIAVRAARQCHDECLEVLMQAGYPPYRVGTMGMAMLDKGSHVFWDVVAQIKVALDPHAILSRGRYDPAGARQTISKDDRTSDVDS